MASIWFIQLHSVVSGEHDVLFIEDYSLKLN